MRDILGVDVEDGLEFDVGSIRSEVARDGADYTGVRVHLVAHLAKAEIAFHVAVNFGDTNLPSAFRTWPSTGMSGSAHLAETLHAMGIVASTVVTAARQRAVDATGRSLFHHEPDAVARSAPGGPPPVAMGAVGSSSPSSGPISWYRAREGT